MKHKITKNWGLKLGSFIFAAALWLIVTNINDPITTYRVSDVPVTIRNANLITDKGQIYEVLGETNVIDTVTISAPRSVIDSLDKSNVVATADMNDLTNLDTIPIRLSTNKYNDKLESIKGNIDSVRLNIEALKNKTLQIRTNISGEVKEGYILGDVSTEQNLIKVSGPESVISQISKAMVEIDVSGFTGYIGTDSTIRLYNENDEEIVSDSIEKSIEKVRVSVEILELKRIPVTYVVTGSPADGYLTTGQIDSTRDTVLVAGKSKAISNISALEVPEGVVDITGARESVTALVDLKEYLPDGIVLADEDFTGKVNVTVYIEQAAEREFIIPVERVRIDNLPAGYTAKIVEPEEECRVVVSGLNEYVQAIEAGSITASIDIAAWMAEEEINEIGEGTYQIELNVPLPNEEVYLKRAVSVSLHIAQEEE